MKRGWIAALTALLALPAAAQDLRPDQHAFRALYRELVETNTTLSAGSCTLAAQKMTARLKAAGYPESDLHPFSVADHPKEGGLVGVLPGSDPKAKAILLLAHLDVVEAKREDWTRDPFKLVEEGGYSTAAAPPTTNPWPPSGSIPWSASNRIMSHTGACSNWP